MTMLDDQLEQLAKTDDFSDFESDSESDAAPEPCTEQIALSFVQKKILENFYRDIDAQQKQGAVIETKGEIDLLWSIYINGLSTEKRAETSTLRPILIYNQLLVKMFYKYIDTDRKEGKVETMEKVSGLWSTYISDLLLPEQKVEDHPFTPLIIYQPQTLPQHFNYLDVLKVLIRMMIPDWQLTKHLQLDFRGQRNDELFGRVKITQLADRRYKLLADSSADIKLFEEFVVKNEISLDDQSAFKAFEKFLRSQKQLDRYTQHDLSLMLRDEVYKSMVEIFKDKELINDCQIANIDFASLIDFVHCVSGWLLAAFIREKNKPQVEGDKDFDANDDVKFDKKKVYREIQEYCQISAARKICFGFSNALIVEYYTAESSEMPDVFNQYLQYTRRTIALGLMPAFTSKYQELQAVIYPAEDHARKKSVELDNMTQSNIALMLGLPEGGSYKQFICDHYSFPDSAFNFSSPLELMSDEEIVEHFFISNVGFFAQIDRERVRENIYNFIVTELWQDFVEDVRCSESIRHRCATINITTSTKILFFINEFFHSNTSLPEKVRELEIFFLKLAKNNQALLLVFCEAMLVYSSAKVECESTREEDYFVLYLQNELKKISSLSGKSISALIDCKYLPLKYRLSLMSVIAEATYFNQGWGFHREFYGKIKDFYRFISFSPQDFLDFLFHENIFKEVAQAIHKISLQEDISILIYWYENEEFMLKNHGKFLAVAHMQHLFKDQNLTELRFYLNQVLCRLQPSPSFYAKLKREEGLVSVIEMIDDQQPWLYILSALKSVAKKNKQAVSDNFHEFYAKVYEVLSFSNSYIVGGSPKTAAMLFSVMQEGVSPKIPEIKEFGVSGKI